MPVRKVSNRGGNIIGYFPSLTMRRMIAFESTIERDELTLADFDPDVLTIEEQPLTISYQHNNKTATYTPDLLIQTLEKSILIECKPATMVNTEDNQRKFRAAEVWCKENGHEFQIVTDEQLRSGSRLANVKKLTQYARHFVHPHTKSRVYNILQGIQTPVTLLTLAQEIAPNNPLSVMSTIFHLAYHHQIALDLDSGKLYNSSLCWLPFSKERQI